MRSLLVSLALFLSLSASAATYTVTSSADSGPGTLRQAILDANANPGRDAIALTVPTVTITSALPAFTEAVDIDGDVSGSRVQITAACCSSFPITFAAGSSTSTMQNVKADNGVEVDAGVTNVIFTSNAILVLDVYGDSNTVTGDVNSGGTATFYGSNNVLLSSTYTAVLLEGGSGNRVGNTSGGGNTSIMGMRVDNSTNAIIEGNAFIGGGPWALVLTGASTGATIRGNTFTNNGDRALDINASNTLVEDNTIFGNFNAGISVTGATGVTITRNSLYDNGIPIDLGFNGPTANDPLDADSGANNLQNDPVMTSAQLGATSVTIAGSLASTPLTTFTIEFFSNPASDPEARTYLGSTNVTTDAAGNATFSTTISSPLPALGEVITATATNQTTGDTSEVSAPATVVAAPAVAAETIPTASEWGLLALATALIAIVMLRLRV